MVILPWATGCGEAGDGAQAQDTLLRALSDDDAAVRSLTLHEIPPGSEVGERVFSAIVDRLGDESEAVRVAAACALGRLEHGDEPALVGLAGCLSDGSARVRWAGLYALGRLEGAPEGVEERLGTLSGDPGPLVREELARAIGGNASLRAGMNVVLCGLLFDTEPDVRQATAWAMGEFGPGGREFSELLERALREESSPLAALSVARAIWKVTADADALVRVSVAGARSENVNVRRSSAFALRQVAGICREESLGDVEASLRGLSADGDPATREGAAAGLQSVQERRD